MTVPKTMIYLQKNGRKDDTIIMTPRGKYAMIEYRDSDEKGAYTFYLDEDNLPTYLNDLFLGLSRDADPFRYIQVTPCTGPAILYNVSEMDCEFARDTLSAQISRSLFGGVTYNRFA
jgi:hypothetical protein